MLLSELIKRLDIIESNVPADAEITGLSDTNCRIEQGNLFICIVGLRWDGHIFISEALSKGAAAVVVQTRPEDTSIPYILVESTRRAAAFLWMAWYNNPADNLKIIGITGTNGKSSTLCMLKNIFDSCGQKTAAIGTIKYIIGDIEYEAVLTTPDPKDLAKLFAQIRDAGIEYVIMEVSSHSLEFEKVAALSFELGIFTNLTQDHLDLHKSMESYMNAKAKLFSMCKLGLFNLQDPASQKIIEQSTSDNYTYAIEDNNADFVAKEAKYKSVDGVEYEMLSCDDIFRINSRIPGKFAVYNTLAAAAAAKLMGITDTAIIKGIYDTTVKGRIEKLDIPCVDYSVIIDYAHTPDALTNVLSAINEFIEGRVITLFGCGGDRDKSKRPIMGEIASENSDYCIVTSDNSRSEEPAAIIADIAAGIKKKNYTIIEDRTEAIKHALSIAKRGDAILLAGKGHEEYVKDKNGTSYYSERDVVFEALGIKK